MGWVTRTIDRVTAWVTPIVEWVMALKPMRVFTMYAEKRGFLLSAGLAYQSIFAVFAGLWVGFSIAGLIVSADIGLRTALIDVLALTVPGLIATEENPGVIRPNDLLSATVFGWTGAIALTGLLFSALGWLAGARDAVRIMFDLPGSRMNIVLLKLKDFGLALGFGLALALSALLSVVGSEALGVVLEWLGIRTLAPTGTSVRVATLSVMFLLDAFVLAMLYRVLAGMPIPRRHLVQGALLGALGLGVLKVLGGFLLGGASNNPLLASFAVLIGLMIWFNFVCQVILLAAAWAAVGVDDDGIVLDEVVHLERIERARALVAANEPEAEKEKRSWLDRLLRRD